MREREADVDTLARRGPQGILFSGGGPRCRGWRSIPSACTRDRDTLGHKTGPVFRDVQDVRFLCGFHQGGSGII